MKRISIKQTSDSPKLTIEYEVGLIELTGKAIAHKPVTSYTSLDETLTAYCQNPEKESTVAIRLTNLSTSASKWLYHLLKELEKNHGEKTEFAIEWYYHNDDDVMFEIGEDFQQIIDLPFQLIVA